MILEISNRIKMMKKMSKRLDMKVVLITQTAKKYKIKVGKRANVKLMWVKIRMKLSVTSSSSLRTETRAKQLGKRLKLLIKNSNNKLRHLRESKRKMVPQQQLLPRAKKRSKKLTVMVKWIAWVWTMMRTTTKRRASTQMGTIQSRSLQLGTSLTSSRTRC